MYLVHILIFIFGACIGSFLNVVILRLKAGQKFVKGRSSCPKCQHILKWYENIPVLSFIILRAKCSSCDKKISWQYPLVEFTTGILFLLAFTATIQQFNTSALLSAGNLTIWQFNNSLFLYSFIPLIFFYWLAISFLIIIFVYDLKYYLIPDKISIPAIIIVAVFQLILNFLNNSYKLQVTSYGLLIFSAIIISSFFCLQFILSKGKWIGGGDIRLGFLMGLILGWPLGIVALFGAYLLGLIVCLPLLILKKKGLKSEIPFGVFLASATFIVMLWGEQILNWYLSKIV